MVHWCTPGALQNGSGKGHTTRVVLDLLEVRLDSGHSIYMDNFYNSYELDRQLTIRGTYCTGTLNVKRRHKDVLTKKTQKRGLLPDTLTTSWWQNGKTNVMFYIYPLNTETKWYSL
ncbi:hypothetical protein NQ314_008857 [Rhamnusium bicolor]|uniref:PiggyBac transposable element-derived protein domain-containing protein n=1 Tax=Rhamnusium bicolor TaxID=1586634 RepID=A0AAV8Y789_9CUCU|nr:hypothetical protein NQ314_008857 [Rhamnusium bicolor]